MVLLGTFPIYSLDNLIYIFIIQVECCNNQYMFNFQKICMTSYMKMNIVGKQKI